MIFLKSPQCGLGPRLNILRVIISLFFLMNCLVCSSTIALYQDWLDCKQYYVISADYLFHLTSSQVFSRDIISQRVGLAWLQLAPSSLFIQTVAPSVPPAGQPRSSRATSQGLTRTECGSAAAMRPGRWWSLTTPDTRLGHWTGLDR